MSRRRRARVRLAEAAVCNARGEDEGWGEGWPLGLGGRDDGLWSEMRSAGSTAARGERRQGWRLTGREATHHSVRGAWSRLFLIPALDVGRMRLRHCYNYQCGVEEPAGEARAFWTRVRSGVQ